MYTPSYYVKQNQTMMVGTIAKNSEKNRSSFMAVP
jgi:hypothetical protein